jgi:hypothetical protein
VRSLLVECPPAQNNTPDIKAKMLRFNIFDTVKTPFDCEPLDAEEIKLTAIKNQ